MLFRSAGTDRWDAASATDLNAEAVAGETVAPSGFLAAAPVGSEAPALVDEDEDAAEEGAEIGTVPLTSAALGAAGTAALEVSVSPGLARRVTARRVTTPDFFGVGAEGS